jgi:hypothetical protein
LAQTLFGIFSGVITEENQEMAYLFMDLCFDVLYVYQKAFGPLQNDMDFDCLLRTGAGAVSQLFQYVGDRIIYEDASKSAID